MIRRREVWLVEFEPQRGAEIRKTRPAVVVSSQFIEALPAQIVVPIRERKPHHDPVSFFVRVTPDAKNGSSKLSSADCSQIKSFAVERFVKKLGEVDEATCQKITDGICLCIDV